MKKATIIGAGPAGLIVAKAILDHTDIDTIKIWDPHFGTQARNHPFFIHADVGSRLGIPLRKVKVQEVVLRCSNPGLSANVYSMKTTGALTRNRVWDIDGASQENEWYLSPDLIRDLELKISNDPRVTFLKAQFDIHAYAKCLKNDEWVVSTIPLSSFLSIVPSTMPTSFGGSGATFSSMMLQAWKTRSDKAQNVCQVIYDCRQGSSWSRIINVEGNILVEGALKSQQIDALELPWPYREIFEAKDPKEFATSSRKIIPANVEAVNAFVTYMTTEHRTLFIGRHALWRYKRVDHLPDDALAITKIIRLSGKS